MPATPRQILVAVALVLTLLAAVGYCPLWVAVLLVCIALLLP